MEEEAADDREIEERRKGGSEDWGKAEEEKWKGDKYNRRIFPETEKIEDKIIMKKKEDEDEKFLGFM